MVSQFLRNPFSPSYGLLPYAVIAIGLVCVSSKGSKVFKQAAIITAVCVSLFMASTVAITAQRIINNQPILPTEVYSLNNSKKLGIVTGILAFSLLSSSIGLANSFSCAQIVAFGCSYWHSRKIDLIRH